MCVPAGEPAPGIASEGDQIYVAMPDGRWQGNAVNAHHLEEGDAPESDEATADLAAVADAAQETVMELLWQVWPICPAHKIGTHPSPAGTTDGRHQYDTDSAAPPVWWCRGGSDGICHDVSPVGELATTLSGKQRRALRHSDREQDRHRGGAPERRP
jgi:hypothetical protein